MFFTFPALPAIPLVAAFMGGQVQDILWQDQFVGAASWAAYGVIDDSGVTDNTAALNSIPAGTTIIADCQHGGFVQYSGTWVLPAGLKVWQKSGCWLKSTIVTPGVYPMTGTGGTTATSSTPDISYYGLQFSFITPTRGVRVIQCWCDHLKIKYFEIDGSGGFAWIRGSDREIAYGVTKNTIQTTGNPGIRDVGTLPEVPMSVGMRAHNWYHNLNFDSGDAAFQACQPAANPLTWFYQTSTDSSDDFPAILYEDSYSSSAVGFIALVNESDQSVGGATNYVCRDVTFNNVSGIGSSFMAIGNSSSETSHIRVYGGSYVMGTAQNAKAPLSVGNYPVGTGAAPSANVFDVIVDGLTISGEFSTAIAAVHSRDTHFRNIAIGRPKVGTGSAAASIWTDGAVGTEFSNITLDVGNNVFGVADGMNTNSFGQVSGPSSTPSTGTVLTNVRISSVVDGKVGLNLVNSSGARVTGGFVTPVVGATTATGLVLATDPNGTHDAIVSGFNTSAMPVPVVCAPGQGNVVPGCPP